MYPLKVLLVGCANADIVLPTLRRELSSLNVGVEGEFADCRSCLSQILSNPAEKRLVLALTSSAADTEQLARLNEAVAGLPILALVDPSSDSSLMIRAMRAGAAQVVRLPLESEDFHDAMRRIAIQFGHPLTQSRVITVFGASEGCGASTIALNLASEIGRVRQATCILGEAAVGFGRLANYLGIEPQLTIADLLTDMELLDIERVRRSLTKIEDHLQVIVGAYRSISPVKLNTTDVFTLVNLVKQLSDVVVLDGRYTYEEIDFEFLTQTQQLVLVAKPTVPSIHNLMTLMTHLAERKCLAQQFVVINQFAPDVEGFSLDRLAKILSVPKVYPVATDVVGIQTSVNFGKTLRQAAPRSRSTLR